MNGTLLRFYVHENRKHRHRLLYEFLLEQAKRLGNAARSPHPTPPPIPC